jgi:hypothetical protein
MQASYVEADKIAEKIHKIQYIHSSLNYMPIIFNSCCINPQATVSLPFKIQESHRPGCLFDVNTDVKYLA